MKYIQKHYLHILNVGIFISIIIRAFIIINSKHVADIELLFRMGDELVKGNNPYLRLEYNVYPPLAIYLEALTIHLSRVLGIPFHILTRVWPNIADILATVVIYKYLRRLKFRGLTATLWSLVFVLNPVLIIISAAHGQIDSIVNLLVLFSVYYLSFNILSFSNYLAALFLGFAISIKPNPLILLPFLMFFVKGKIRDLGIFVVLSMLPIVLLLVPFVYENFFQVVSEIITYSGVYDFSLAAIMRGWVYQDNANYWLDNSLELIKSSKLSFLAGLFFLLILFWKTKKAVKALISVYLLFLTIYFGISAQYLIWILPFAVLERSKIVFIYTFVAFIALTGFYLFFGPSILLGDLWDVVEHQSKFMTVYFLGNLGFFLVLISWLILNIITEWQTRIQNINKLDRSLLVFSLILFVLMLLPTIILVFQTVSF